MFNANVINQPMSCTRVRELYPREVADNIVKIEHALAGLDRVQVSQQWGSIPSQGVAATQTCQLTSPSRLWIGRGHGSRR